MSLILKNDDFKYIYYDILNHLEKNGKIQGKSKGDIGLYFELTNPIKSMIPISKNWAWTLIEGIDRLSKIPSDNNPGNAYLFRPVWKKKLINEGGSFCYCLDPETNISSSKNYIKLKNIIIGDSVYDQNGKLVKVKNIFHSKGPALEILTKHNFSIIVSKQHYLSGIKKERTKRKTTESKKLWIKSSDFKIGDYIATKHCGNKNFSSNKAYFFGLIMSDGSTHKSSRIRIRFTNCNFELINEFFNESIKLGYLGQIKHNKKGFYQVTFNAEVSKIIFNELDNFKLYLYEADNKTCLEFLSGFCEGDGYIRKDNNHVIEFCTSPKHPEQYELLELCIRKLGFICKKSIKPDNKGKRSINLKICGDSALRLLKILPLRIYKKPNWLLKSTYSGQGYFYKDSFIFDEIISIKKLPVQKFIDIETDGSFIANGIISHNSYGDCYNFQLPKILKKLKKKGQREAIINVWNYDHLSESTPRRPCTLTLHFIINNEDKLNLFVNMRTNDVMNLLYSDVFHHTLLQKYIASELNLKLGSYFHNCSYFYYQKKRDITGSVLNTMKRLKISKDLIYSDDFKIDSLCISILSDHINRLNNGDYDHHKLYKQLGKSQYSLMYGLALIYIFVNKNDKKNEILKMLNNCSMREFEVIKLKRKILHDKNYNL